MHPSWKLSNLRRRVNRARNPSPDPIQMNTCPSSRHVHIMAECLAGGKKYPMLDEEPEHCAASLLVVLECLWKARTELAKLHAQRGQNDRAMVRQPNQSE